MMEIYVQHYIYCLGDEQGSHEDFQLAANLGGKFAKQQLVLLNPYAALCNQMLGQVIGKVKQGEA